MIWLIPLVISFARADLAVVVDNYCLQELPTELQHKDFHDIRFQAVRVDSINAHALAQHPCILTISENAPVIAAAASDPLSSQQEGLTTINHSAGAKYFYHPVFGVRRPVVAAVVDTGIQPDHPDLQSRMWRGPSWEFGYNVIASALSPSDDNGHGSHVAGVLGAQRGNNVGIQGIMGDWVQLMSIKSLDNLGGGNIADVVNGIMWAADHGAEVINLSLAASGANSSLQTAIEYALSKNVVIVAAAGNLGAEISGANYIVPAAYAPSHDGLISVGAVDALTLARANYSNYSNQYVEIAAPGSIGVNGLLSTYLNSTYVRDKGTSISAPHVAGAAALVVGFLKTHSIPADNAFVEYALKQSANTNSALASEIAGGRWLDLERLGAWLFNSTVIDANGGFDNATP